MTKPLFEERADRTLDKVRAVYAQRGNEYADTWRTCRFLAMKATAKKLGLAIPDDQMRVLATAAFYDMKYERLSGGYKDDSVIDAIAYGSFWVDEMDEMTRPKQAEYSRYRMLNVGETIENGDECFFTEENAWKAIKAIVGTKITKHWENQIRRPINPQENAAR